jgi:hypothetical protein
MATNFDDINLFGDKTLSDIFKQIHKNNKDTDKQISELIEAIKPMITNPGSAVMLMPTVKDLIDVNVKNSDQLIKMAGIAQRAASANNQNSSGEGFLPDLDEIQHLLEEQAAIKEEGAKLLEQTNEVQKQIEKQ